MKGNHAATPTLTTKTSIVVITPKRGIIVRIVKNTMTCGRWKAIMNYQRKSIAPRDISLLSKSLLLWVRSKHSSKFWKTYFAKKRTISRKKTKAHPNQLHSLSSLINRLYPSLKLWSVSPTSLEKSLNTCTLKGGFQLQASRPQILTKTANKSNFRKSETNADGERYQFVFFTFSTTL